MEAAIAAHESRGGYTRPRNLWARMINNITYWSCVTCAVLTIGALALITGYIAWRGFGALTWSLFANLPNEVGKPIGMRNALAGTLILIVTASCIGIPLGVACGIYLNEFAKNNLFTKFIRLTVDVLAATPSIIVGLLGFVLIVKPMGGASGWAGTVALAFMMCPIIARTTEEMLKLVPKSYREGSLGAGASQAQTLFRVTLPAARAGIVTGIMLALARIAGETAPLLFTVSWSNHSVVNFWNGLPVPDMNHDFPTMTVGIYKNVTSEVSGWVDMAWGALLMLIMLILFLNLMVRYVSRNRLGSGH
jgi:phosphate transport system permease protein